MKNLCLTAALMLALSMCFQLDAQADDFLLEDFESYEIGTSFNVRPYNSVTTKASSAVIEANPSGSGKVLHVKQKNGTIVVDIPMGELTVGELTAAYNIIQFDYYRASGESSKSAISIYASHDKVPTAAASMDMGKVKTWNQLQYLMGSLESDNTTISIGLTGGTLDYYIDNLSFTTHDMGYDSSNPEETLRYWASIGGKYIGAAITSSDVKNDDDVAKAYYRNFNMLVAEWEMKMGVVQPSRGKFDFSAGDAILKFADEHDMVLRGHNLCWHTQAPEWLTIDGSQNDKGWSKAEVQAMLKEHIITTVTHYKGRVPEWDVVNECLSDDQSIVDTKSSGYTLRDNLWYRTIGESYLDSAFAWAHQADPDAKLFLNDYGVEHWNNNKAKAFYNLVKKLQKRGAPISGVGFQCHFTVGKIDQTQIKTAVNRYKKLGIDVEFTETDLCFSDGTKPTTNMLNSQARDYKDLAELLAGMENCKALLVWGLQDGDSWLDDDHSYAEPLLLDRFLGAKPAYISIRNVLKSTYAGVFQVPESKLNRDVYDVNGKLVAHGIKPADILLLPPGLYLSEGKKYLVR